MTQNRPYVPLYEWSCFMCGRVADSAAIASGARCSVCGGNLIREQIGSQRAPIEEIEIEIYVARRGRPPKDRNS